jgi:3-isopropylmalate dehydratase small subunit
MSFSYEIEGRIWTFGDDVDTDQILPGYAMAEPVDKLKNFALAGSKYPDFAKEVQAGDIIIAGDNFGAGSSREQAAVALKEAGTGVIIAKSFARIFRRNAINIALPVIEDDILEKFVTVEKAKVDLENFKIVNLDTQETFELNPINENVMETLKSGGLIEKVRKQLVDKI